MKYFAYGSNMNLEQMKDRCPHKNHKVLGKAILHGYEFFINARGVASIAMDSIDTDPKVYGVLFEISDNCLACLDMHEGHPNAYRRDMEKVMFEDEEVDAWVYIDQRSAQTGTPRPGYLERIIQAAINFGFPKEYVDYLRSFAKD